VTTSGPPFPPNPPPIELPALDDADDGRRLAETLVRLHHVLNILVTYGEFFLPGEALDEVRAAWSVSDKRFATFIQRFAPPQRAGPHVDLESGHLGGPPGRMKRAFLDREYDGFMSHWNSQPRKKVRLERARRRAANLADGGATLLGSVPGGEPFAELVAFIGKHVLIRMERGY
jgi:hypothetical protein